ncbi:MAG: hypothetical protein ACRDN0_04100 [Trebonia sp.]
MPASLVPGIRAAAGDAFAGAMHVADLCIGIGSIVLLAVAVVFIASRPQHTVTSALAEAPAGVPAGGAGRETGRETADVPVP